MYIYGDIEANRRDSEEVKKIKKKIFDKWCASTDPPTTTSAALLSKCSLAEKRRMAESAERRLRKLIPGKPALPADPQPAASDSTEATTSEAPVLPGDPAEGASPAAVGFAVPSGDAETVTSDAATVIPEVPTYQEKKSEEKEKEQEQEEKEEENEDMKEGNAKEESEAVPAVTITSKYKHTVFLRSKWQCVVRCGVCDHIISLPATSTPTSLYLCAKNFRTHVFLHIGVSATGQRVRVHNYIVLFISKLHYIDYVFPLLL